MNKRPPVGIVTLNRKDHLEKCLKSLRLCQFADETEVYIAVDFPPSKKYEEGYKKVMNYLNLGVPGFKKVHILWREENLGPVKNNFSLRDEILKSHDTLITTEDDNVFARNFLDYMFKGLEAHKSNPKIWAIVGYNDPINMPSWYTEETYLRTGSCMWGIGFWKEKLDQVDWSMESFKAWLDKDENRKYIKKYHAKAIPQLMRMYKSSRFQGDGFLFAFLVDQKMKSVYPVKSLVRNIGHDGSGLHVGHNDRYSYQEIDNRDVFPGFNKDLDFNYRLQAEISQQIDGNWRKKIKHKSFFWSPLTRFLLNEVLLSYSYILKSIKQ